MRFTALIMETSPARFDECQLWVFTLSEPNKPRRLFSTLSWWATSEEQDTRSLKWTCSINCRDFWCMFWSEWGILKSLERSKLQQHDWEVNNSLWCVCVYFWMFWCNWSECLWWCRLFPAVLECPGMVCVACQLFASAKNQPFLSAALHNRSAWAVQVFGCGISWRGLPNLTQSLVKPCFPSKNV